MVAELRKPDYPRRWWAILPDGRIECRLCPRFCKLNEGQHGFCFVRQRIGGQMVLNTYGRSSGFCVDPIACTDAFYHRLCFAQLQPVLETLKYLRHETNVWFEVTTLLIPGENDSDAELHRASEWFMENLGPDVPWHFTAFHPDFKMLDKPRTPPTTLTRARDIARSKGLHYVYTGNVHDRDGGSTWCPGCGDLLIERDWYELGKWSLENGRCRSCGYKVAGVFEAQRGDWGAQRVPVRVAAVR